MHGSPATPTQIRNDIPALTGLRFIAAMMVAVGHGAPLIVGMPGLVQLLMPLAGLAMAPFFVLSGFVIWLNYASSFIGRISRWKLRSFAIARFARLWPMYTVTLLIALTRMAFSGEQISGTGTLLFFAGIQAWIPAVGNRMAAFTLPFAAHLWSVSTELFLYALFPLLCMPIARLRSVTSVVCVSLINAGVAYTLHRLRIYNPGAVQAAFPMLPPIEALQWVGYYSPGMHVFEFLAGCLAARAYEILRSVAVTPIERRVARNVAYLSLIVFLVVFLMYQLNDSFGLWLFAAAVFMRTGPILPLAFLVFYAARYPGLLSRSVSLPFMVLGGEASYSIYLLHPLAEDVWRHLPGALPWLPTMISFIGLMAFTIGISVITFRWIEVPSRSYLRKTL